MPVCVGVGGFLRKSASIWSWNDFDRVSFASEHVSRFLYCGVLPRRDEGKAEETDIGREREFDFCFSLIKMQTKANI